MKMQAENRTPALKRKGLVWGVALCAGAVLAGGALLWSRVGSVENALSIASTALAAAVLAVTLLLSLASKPRTK